MSNLATDVTVTSTSTLMLIDCGRTSMPGCVKKPTVLIAETSIMKRTEARLDRELSTLSVDNTVHIIHSHNKPDGHRTSAYIIRGTTDEYMIVAVATANCNPKDNFCRRVGRLIAKGRLLAGKGVEVAIMGMNRLPENSNEWRRLDRAVMSKVTGA